MFSDEDTDWQEFLAWQKVNAACNVACNHAECQFWYHWSRFSLAKSYDYSQKTEGDDNFQDLKEEAVLKSVCSLHVLMPPINSQFDACKEMNTAIEQNWIWMYWLSSVQW